MSTPTATPRTDAAWRRYNCAELPDPQELVKEMTALEAELACEKTNRNHLIEKGAKLETELAAAKAECDLNRTRIASIFLSGAMDKHTGGDVQKWAADYTAELTRLRADLERFTGHGLLDCHAICDQRDAAVAERDRLRAENEQLKADVSRETTVCDTACMEAQRLRAEVERLKGLASWANTCIHHNDAERARYGHVCPVCTSTRAEKAEAELARFRAENDVLRTRPTP